MDKSTEYIYELYNSLIDLIKFTIKLVKDLELENSQEYLDFMDRLNKLSIE